MTTQPTNDIPTGHLRILQTTDLHMQLLPYDYFADHRDENTGLIHLAGTIETLRNEQSSVLLDCGDFLQGNPLADHIANQASADPHPMIAAMNTLRYDAAALGNHEFDYGLTFLRSTLKDAAFPVLCANMQLTQNSPIAAPHTIMTRMITCDDGQTRALRIGIIGLITPQIVQWDRPRSYEHIKTQDIVTTAHVQIPKLKAAGADIIVALCHSGMGATEHTEGMENAAIPLASVPGIDAILMGHTHEVFPNANRTPSDIIDPVRGTLHGKPAVMAGFYGNGVGVIDLSLSWRDNQWEITGHQTQVVQGQPGNSRLTQTLTKQVRPAHEATLTHIRQPIAETTIPIHSYFTTIRPDIPQQLLADAQRQAIAHALKNRPHAKLPLLAATSPFLFGGKAGPGHYIDIPPGPLRLRDAVAIYPFGNTLCAVRRTGKQLRNWLERAAAHYLQIAPGKHDQSLLNPLSPAYSCDTLHGLSYEIDLTQPAQFGPDSIQHNTNANRVRDIRYMGRPINDDMAFIVATNSYRASGGGGFDKVPVEDVLHVTPQTTRDLLINHLRTAGRVENPPQQVWRFTPIADTSVTFPSSPAAKAHLTPDITYLGAGDDGFARYQLKL